MADKHRYKKNNKKKADTTQNDWKTAVTALRGSDAAAQASNNGTLPPVDRIGRQNKEGSASPLESQVGSIAQPHIFNMIDGQFSTFKSNGGFLANLETMLQQTADPGVSFQDTPTYASPYLMKLPQHGQPFVPQQSRTSVPQPDAQPFVPQQHQPVPPPLRTHNLRDPGVAQHLPYNFGGYKQSLFPINLYNNFNGPIYTPTFPLSTPSGNFSTHMGNYNMYIFFSMNPAMLTCDANMTHDAPTPFQTPQATFSNKTSGKHRRTATMDAQPQPIPTRVKR
jgi:hypothetical protein